MSNSTALEVMVTDLVTASERYRANNSAPHLQDDGPCLRDHLVPVHVTHQCPQEVPA
ncbi:hypothetical protein [Serinicoccus sediminis]|uniref:hypothetical protein n=1 Tax=Serinicoccus sediminis TaxID=2306021 RepID=UPI0013ED4AA9|nr:hypothetical protein [Serinicoccus sediminis]